MDMFSFLLKSEKESFQVEENVLLYNSHIFIFIPVQWTNIIFNSCLMEEEVHESKNAYSP